MACSPDTWQLGQYIVSSFYGVQAGSYILRQEGQKVPVFRAKDLE